MLALTPTLNLDNLASQMVFVKGGTFKMGGDYLLEGAMPIHKVQLDDFYICRYQVSQLLWREVMGNDPKELYYHNLFRSVEGISWEEITEKFLPALWNMTGVNSYSLPSEAQWEFAARGGIYESRNSNFNENGNEKYDFAGSNTIQEVGWYKANSYRESYPLGLKRPNVLGLYDMSGNVRELCNDWYNEEYYQKLVDQYGNLTVNNPIGPVEGNTKVIRGGSWNHNSDFSRVPLRFFCSPYTSANSIGFRLCCNQL